MSHPLRVRILAMLTERVASPVELAEWLDASLGVVAYHVRTLHRLGMIDLVKETRVRGAVEHHYRAKERPRVSDVAWAEAPPIAKQAAVGSALQMIYEYASASAAAGGFDAGDTHLARTMMRLDPQGREELSRAFVELLEKTRSIEDAAKQRLAADPQDEDVCDVALVLLLFDAIRLSEVKPENDGKLAANA